MKTVLKSFIYSFYFAKVSLKNYLPLIVYLVISQFLIMITQNMILVLVFFMLYLIASAPVALNVFRNIIAEEDIIDSYSYFIDKSFSKLFVKKIMYLAGSMFLIYLAHIIVLSPFFPSEIQKISPYLYILFMYMIYIYTRIIFILPAASNNISKSLKESYVLTKGNSIRIYFMYVLILVPYLLINIAISRYASINYEFIFVFISIIMQVFFTIISSALIAYIYKDFYKITD
jgi:hypothetical protein|tara:strand:+ start:207 stop:899 length:693 start_codon:yes stop_codon:yes gene_type:complete